MEPFVQQQDQQFHIQPWTKQWSWLSAGITSRLGGVSQHPFQGANYALHVGDHDEHVIMNRKELCRNLAVPFEAWTSAEQVHSSNIVRIGSNDRGKGRLSREDAIQNTDGMITAEKNILLTSFYADCVPLYFVDPTKKVIGVAHAGWKGTVQQIATKMVENLVEEYHCSKEDIHAAIGPAIGGCCYEVNEIVANQIRSLPIQLNDEMLQIKDDKPGHYDLNLHKVNYALLLHAGIKDTQLLVTNWCTKCNNNLFYSYRNESGETGRHCSWMVMREE